MAEEIRTRKNGLSGNDRYKTISVRMKVELLEKLDVLAVKINRSRSGLINVLLVSAFNLIRIIEE